MQEFEKALSAFFEGRIAFDDLRQAVQVAASSTPSSASQILDSLQDRYRAGRLPHQLYALLEADIRDAPGDRVSSSQKEQAELGACGQSGAGSESEDAKAQRMSAERWAKVQAVLEKVLEQPVEKRSGYLVKAAAGDKMLQREVMSLLKAHDQAPTFLEGNAAQVAAPLLDDKSAAPGHDRTRVKQPATAKIDVTSVNFASPRHDQNDGPLDAGSVLNDRFVLETLLGSGGMGKVYKSLDWRKVEAKDENPYVAVKVLNERFKQHPESLVTLQRECLKTQKLAHPNIVNVFDFDRDHEHPYMTMEYLEGKPLDELIKTKFRKGLPFKKAWPIIRGAALALLHAHENDMVHLDFKPGNVFLLNDGHAKVLDLGIARAVKGSEKQQRNQAHFDPADDLHAMTLAYASCEMIEEQTPDPRDDIYGLACVTYELLTGKHPFTGNRRVDKIPATRARKEGLKPKPIDGLSNRRWRALAHALAFDRDDRTASVKQFLDELEGVSRFNVVQIAAATGFTIVGVWLLLTFLTPGPEEAFSRKALAMSAGMPTPLPPDEQGMIDLWLAQGQLYLSGAENKFDPCLLSTCPDNALSAFINVLELAPSEDAADAILRIIELYTERAQDLENDDKADEANKMRDLCGKILTEHLDFPDLESDLCQN